MDLLQRLQPLDYLFAIVWAAIIGWGLRTGLLRQLSMLIGTYGAAVVSGSVYHQAGRSLARAFGIENVLRLEFVSYVGLFIATFGLIGLIIWRAYPQTRLGRGFGMDNAGGAVVAAIWGVLFLIGVLTMLRYYTVVAWQDQEATQHSVLAQIRVSQTPAVLEVILAPLWQSMTPWFPEQVNAQV